MLLSRKFGASESRNGSHYTARHGKLRVEADWQKGCKISLDALNTMLPVWNTGSNVRI